MTRAQTARLKRHFLELFARQGNISAACRALGLERRRVYDWQESDDQFAAAFREAEIESTERLEAEAYRRAHDGVARTKRAYYAGEVIDEIEELEYSDTLLIFLLKARRPDKYREKFVGVASDQAPIKAYAGFNVEDV